MTKDDIIRIARSVFAYYDRTNDEISWEDRNEAFEAIIKALEQEEQEPCRNADTQAYNLSYDCMIKIAEMFDCMNKIVELINCMSKIAESINCIIEISGSVEPKERNGE